MVFPIICVYCAYRGQEFGCDLGRFPDSETDCGDFVHVEDYYRADDWGDES